MPATSEHNAHWPDSFPAVEIDVTDDGLIRLSCPDPLENSDDVIVVHPLQVLHIAGKFGLLRASDPSALRVIATLKRRMKTLLHRIDRLDEMLRLCGEHENLEGEQDFSFATWEIATEFCADLDDLCPHPQAAPEAPAARPPTPGVVRPSMGHIADLPSAADGKPMANAKPKAEQLDLVGGGAKP